MRRPDLALFQLIALWLSTAAMIVAFGSVSANVAWPLAPYLAWVSFAGVLNYAIVIRNPRSA